MIAAPVQDTNRAVWRAVAEAAAQFTPVTAALTRIYQTTHPSLFEKDLSSWRDEVTGASNDHEARLLALEAVHHPTLRLSADAQTLARWLAQTSPTGLADPVEFDDVQSAFPDRSARDLHDAAAELKMYGLVTVSVAIGHPVRSITPAYELFALFDPIERGTSPQDDAVILARTVLNLDSGLVPELEAYLGWNRRRLNPALALLLTLVPDGRIRQVIQADYVSLGFMVTADERVRFKALLASSATPVEPNPDEMA